MSRVPKGFYVRLHTFATRDVERGISFQLKPDGVRYFFVMAEPQTKREVRDVSTQYRSLIRTSYGRLWLGEEETKKAQEKLVEHAHAFYPEFVIPQRKHTDPYPWVAFPMIGAAMRKSNLHAPFGVNLQIASGLRAFTVQAMTERIFGESPKQLQAAVAESLVKGTSIINIDNLTLASLLRGYLPPNSLADVLRMDLRGENLIQQTDKHSANNIRLLLRRFNSHRIMRLVHGFSDNIRADMLLRDAANQYADARRSHPDTVMDLSRQFRSLEELHGSISREYRKLAYVNQEIHYSDKLTEDLASISLPDGARLIKPDCTHDLMDWASDQVMNNCIYAYGKDAAAGKCLLLAVLDVSGKMIVNMMIRGQNVTQCFGKANQTVTDELLLEALFKGLIEAEVVSPENDHTDWLHRRMW